MDYTTSYNKRDDVVTRKGLSCNAEKPVSCRRKAFFRA